MSFGAAEEDAAYHARAEYDRGYEAGFRAGLARAAQLQEVDARELAQNMMQDRKYAGGSPTGGSSE